MDALVSASRAFATQGKRGTVCAAPAAQVDIQLMTAFFGLLLSIYDGVHKT